MMSDEVSFTRDEATPPGWAPSWAQSGFLVSVCRVYGVRVEAATRGLPHRVHTAATTTTTTLFTTMSDSEGEAGCSSSGGCRCVDVV